jgi:hypothetical protein
MDHLTNTFFHVQLRNIRDASQLQTGQYQPNKRTAIKSHHPYGLSSCKRFAFALTAGTI